MRNTDIWYQYDRGRLEKKDSIFKTIGIVILNVGCLAGIFIMAFILYALGCIN